MLYTLQTMSGLQRMSEWPCWARLEQTALPGKVLGSLIQGGWWLRTFARVVAGVIQGTLSKCT